MRSSSSNVKLSSALDGAREARVAQADRAKAHAGVSDQDTPRTGTSNASALPADVHQKMPAAKTQGGEMPGQTANPSDVSNKKTESNIAVRKEVEVRNLSDLFAGHPNTGSRTGKDHTQQNRTGETPENRTGNNHTGDPVRQLLEHQKIWRAAERPVEHLSCITSGIADLDQLLPGRGWPRGDLIELLSEHTGIGEMRLLAPALATLSREDEHLWICFINPPFEPNAAALQALGIFIDKVLVVRPATNQDTLWAADQALRTGTCSAVVVWHQPSPKTNSNRHPHNQKHNQKHKYEDGVDAEATSTGAVKSTGAARRNDYKRDTTLNAKPWRHRPTTLSDKDIRRLQLAATQGRTLGILFRHARYSKSSSPSPLRIWLKPANSSKTADIQQRLQIKILKRRGGWATEFRHFKLPFPRLLSQRQLLALWSQWEQPSTNSTTALGSSEKQNKTSSIADKNGLDPLQPPAGQETDEDLETQLWAKSRDSHSDPGVQQQERLH